MKLKNNKKTIADYCSDCLMLVANLRVNQNFGDPDLLRKRFLSLLDRFERRASKSNFAAKDVQKAKFALIAFLDETVISSDWDKKDSWMDNPLQLQIFNRFDAGEKFFQILDNFRTRPHDYIQMLELYYLCLVLGFKGRYGIEKQEKLQILIEETHQDIQRFAGIEKLTLSPNAYPKEKIAVVIKKEIPVWLIAAGALLIGVIIYIFMTMSSSNIATEAVKFIQGNF